MAIKSSLGGTHTRQQARSISGVIRDPVVHLSNQRQIFVDFIAAIIVTKRMAHKQRLPDCYQEQQQPENRRVIEVI